MRPTVNNLGNYGLSCTTVFKEPPLKLFNILTLDEYIEMWLSKGRVPAFCQLDTRPGGQLLVQGTLCDRLVHAISGTIIHSYCPMCLVIHCHERSRPRDVHRIALTLQRSGAVTKLRLTHFGLRDLHEYKVAERFWRRAMSRVTTLLQSGAPKLPILSIQPIWLGATRRLERPWIPHALSIEPTLYARKVRTDSRPAEFSKSMLQAAD